MKKSSIKILLLLLSGCGFFLLNSFLFKINSKFYLFIILFLCLIILYFTTGLRTNHKRYEKDVILTIFIYTLVYYIIIYLLGLIVGFNYSIYNLKILKILKNIVPTIILIIISEVLRYNINIKIEKNSLLLFFSFLYFVLVDTSIPMVISNKNDYFTLLSMQILPSISKNIFLTYSSLKFGYRPNIVYRLLIEIPIYILPIIPYFGDYIESIIRLSLPLGLLIWLYNINLKIKKEKSISNSKITKFINIIILVLLTFIILLNSGIFRYRALVIATGSMIPYYNRGDVVIVKKLNDEDKKELEVKDILVHKRNNKIVVHRIYKKIKSGKEVFYETKGDNNKNSDGYLVEIDEIIGTAIGKIKYIGFPTIALYDLRNN